MCKHCSSLRIAGVIKESVVDGPGLRYVIFTQGCNLKCPGCHNPHTWDTQGGYTVELTTLLQSILEIKLLDGITFSGGEPFLQAAACSDLVTLIRQYHPSLNILVYSGYYHHQLLEMAKLDKDINRLLELADTLIDGPFDAQQKDPTLPFYGSINQKMTVLSKF
jgi:anaerobic ribonucleoside-triphosphate reductase activating protein